jgi:hypothetical protein
MKITIMSIICLIILILIVVGCSNYIGISKKKASLNLETYLQREYNGKLVFSDLNRFFNAATMDPNIFGVLIYDKEIPEIEFYTHLDAKNILVNDTLPMYATTDVMTVDNLYQDALKQYETRQEVIDDFKNEISEVKFSTETIELKFDKNITPTDLENVVARFTDRLNNTIKELNTGFQFSLVIKTPKHPEGFIIIPLVIEDSKWERRPYLLSESINNFEVLETMIQKNIEDKLEVSNPYFKITEYRKIYMDKSSLSKGAWIQYLDDKRIVNDGKGKWENPQTGLYVLYFDLDSKFIYKGELLTEESDKNTYVKELRQIVETIEKEGIRTK